MTAYVADPVSKQPLRCAPCFFLVKARYPVCNLHIAQASGVSMHILVHYPGRRFDADSGQLVCDDRGVCYEITGGIARLLPSQERPLPGSPSTQPEEGPSTDASSKQPSQQSRGEARSSVGAQRS